MTRREIMTVAHQLRSKQGCSMSLALRQAWALRKSLGFSIPVASHKVDDISEWLIGMIRKGANLSAYGIPVD